MIERLLALWKTQPTIIINLLKAAVVLGAAFGFSLSADQVAGLAGVVIAVGAALNWTQVTPNASVRARVRAETGSRGRHPTSKAVAHKRTR
jgi:hypothetical protein